MPKNILFADNHLDFLATWSEYLEMAGYQVYRATNPDEVRQIIYSRNVHLAILDKRLLDDNNVNDNSGIELAKAAELGFIPSIILTDFPTHQDVREVLRPGESSAVDFVDKKADGPAGLLDAVARAFDKHILINWELPFNWEPESGLSIPGILGMMEKDVPADEFLYRKDELEDLLRMIFYKFDEITFLRWLWTDHDRVALLAQGQHAQANRYYTITIGSLAAIAQEIAHPKILPDDPGEGSTAHTGFYRRAHFAANIWRLSGVEVAHLDSLQEAADNLREKQLESVLTKLLRVTLLAWRKQRDPSECLENPAKVYRKYFALFQLAEPEKVFRNRVDIIAREARRHNLLQDISVSGARWRVQVSPRLVLTFPDPCQVLFGDHAVAGKNPTYTNTSPGRLKLNTILLGADQVTWLTDLAWVDELPIWHDYACLECELRFNLLDSVKPVAAEASKLVNPDSTRLTELAELERQLRPSWPKLPRPRITAPPEMRKFASGILRVREVAYSQVQNDPQQYALCLLFNALAELLEAEITSPPLPKDQTSRLVHRLLLAGNVCSDLIEGVSNPQGMEYPPLRINDDGSVRRGDELIHLSDAEFSLLSVLYEHKGEICARGVICREGFGIDDPSYDQLHNYIDSNLNRLREKIEPDPKNPRYVITVPRRGLKLLLKPDAGRSAK